MRFALMLESQQGLSYGDHVAIAKRAEANGFEALFRSDHYQSFPGPTGQPTTDAWTVMAGLARDTDRIGLGVLVSPVTFRHPGSFAKVVTTVDEMSGGRIEVGVGAGWNELEHRQLGLPFPPIKERADLMEDQLAILHGLWGEPDGWSYDGHQVSIRDAQFHPKPVDVPGRPRTPIGGARPRLLVGGQGIAALVPAGGALRRRVQPELVGPGRRRARPSPRVDAACVAIGRDPATLDPLDDGRRPDRPGRGRDGRPAGGRGRQRSARATTSEAWLDERLERWITGTPDEARERSAGSRRPASSGSCSRTSCPGTST